MRSPSELQAPWWRRPARGFTLVELLVVLVILGLLVGLVAPRAIEYLSRAKLDVARIQIDNLATGLDLYRLDVGRYPTAEEGLSALVARPAGAKHWNGPYLDGISVPVDPWDRTFTYRIPGSEGRPYDLITLGADGAEGGEGEDVDIVR